MLAYDFRMIILNFTLFQIIFIPKRFVVNNRMGSKDIAANFKTAFPNDSILVYEFKSGGASSYDGNALVDVKLDTGYHLLVFKLNKSTGPPMSSDEIKSKALVFINDTKNETDGGQRRNILRDKLENVFPDHRVNIFIFGDGDWSRYGSNIKGITCFEKDYGSHVDIVLN